MNKWIAVFTASVFAIASTAGFAADAAKKKEDLTTEQKTEIRDRVERLKAERTKAEASPTTPAKPEKTATPRKQTSKVTKPAKKNATTAATPAAPATQPKS